MTFVAGRSDTLVAIDETGHLKEINLTLFGHDHAPSGSSHQRTHIMRDILLTEDPILWSHFSSDGRTLVYECLEKSTTIHICTFSESSVDRIQVTVNSEFRKFPVLSENGKRLFVLDLAEHDYNWNDFHPTVRVWKDLGIKREKGPALLPGDRAVWGPDGKYIATLWSNTDNNGQFIAVYETRKLKPGSNNKPWRERKISFGIDAFQAQILPRRRPNDDVKILICEVGASQVRRFIVWNATRDKIKNEIEMHVNMQRSLNLMNILNGPRILASGNASLSAGMVEEARWENIDAAGYMLVAEQDVYPKFCISKDEELIAAFSWKHHSCSIISKHSGVTMCSFTLPENIELDPTFMLNAVQFDPEGLHLLIFGDEAIYACSPSFVYFGGSDTSHQLMPYTLQSVLFPHGSGADVAKSLVSNLDHSVLAEEALFRLTNGDDISDSDLMKEKTARMVHILADESLLRFGAIPTPGTSRSYLWHREHPSEELSAGDVPSPSDNSITRAFLFESGDGCCGIYFIYGDKTVIYREQNETHRFKIDTDRCFAISLVDNRANMLMLDRKSVYRVDLGKEEVVCRINYRVDFGELINMLKTATEWILDGKWNTTRYSGRCISDDGQKVLLGWDTKNGRSIIVTPNSRQAEVVQRIQESDASLSDFCCLSRDGNITLFADTDELTEGRFTVGIYDERGVKTENLDHSALCALLQCLFFDMTPDCSRIVTVIAGDENISGSIKENECIRTICPWGRKSFVPDYNRLTKGTYLSREKAIEQAAEEFGFDNVFNTQHSRGGDPILVKAIKDEDEPLTDGIFELAKKQNGHVRLDWKASNEKDPVDLIEGAIINNDGILIKKILALIGTGIFPFVQAAKAVKKHMRMLLKRYPEIFETALLQDYLLVEITQLKVLPDYLNARKRHHAAIHISTTDNVLEWKLDETPDRSEARWSHLHHEEVEKLEHGEYHPKVPASLKAVCIDNAAGIGMKGIIRPLLMRTRELSADVFKSTIVKSVVLFKWYKIWKDRFLKSAFRYLIFLSVFTAYAIMVGKSPSMSDESTFYKTVQYVLLGWIFMFGLSMLFEEIRQIRNYTIDGAQYFKKPFWGIIFFLNSRWNWIDVTSCLLLLIFIPFFHLLTIISVEAEEWLSGFIAAEAIIASIKVWYFAQPFRKSGALVLMVENIINDSLIFLLLAFFILFGFALALHVLYRTIVSGETLLSKEEAEQADQAALAFGDFKLSLHTMFYAMIGTFEPEIYSPNHTSLTWLIKIILAVYLIIQMVLLLNLLIAIMGDTFDKVKNSEEAAMLKGRANIIDASEASMTELDKENLEKQIGKYLQLLVPVDEDDDEATEWLGRVQVLERSFKRSFRQNENMVKELVRNLEERVEETSQELGQSVGRLGTRIGGIESRMEEMDRRLGENLDKLLSLIERQGRT